MLDVLIALVRSPLTALRGNRDLALEDLALRVTVQGGSRWRKRRRPIHPEKPAFVLGPPRRVRGYAPRRPCGRARFFGRLDRRFAPGLNGYRCAISSWLPTESSYAPDLATQTGPSGCCYTASGPTETRYWSSSSLQPWSDGIAPGFDPSGGARDVPEAPGQELTPKPVS